MRIGLLIQDIITEYSNMIIKGARKYCLEHDIQLFVFIIRSKSWEGGIYDYQHYACKSLATRFNVDGILLVTSTYCQYFPKDQHEELVNELKYLPLVSLGEKISDIPCVNSGSNNCVREILNHLDKEQNCSRIFFVGPRAASEDILLRLNAFREFSKEKNVNPEERIIYAEYSSDNAFNALSKMNISKENLPFDALVCATDDLAFGCIEYLKENEIRIPRDVKVSGFDNQLRCDSIKPGVTSVDMCIDEQSYRAAELLHSEILDVYGEKKNIEVEAKVIYRDSTGSENVKTPEESSEGKYFQLREHVYRYQYFLQNLQVTNESERIRQLIIDSYKKFGIGSCVCCLYDYPKIFLKDEEFDLPEKAKVFFAFNEEKVFDFDANPYLNPKINLTPEGFSFAPGKEVIVTTIFNSKYQYGYIAYTPGDMNYSTYELVLATTGISLATNISFAKKVSETERLHTEKKLLETETYYDEMTGALNRRGLNKYAIPAIKNSIERNLNGGIVFGDMDHLKRINDTYGHEAGDRAIIGEVEILKKVFRIHDVIARLGGDEFVIVACGLSENTFNEKVKPRLEAITKKYNADSSDPFDVSISLGYAEFSKEKSDLEVLMKEADEKLYEEKVRNHRNRE